MTQVPLAYSPWTGEGLPSKPERFADYYTSTTVFWNYNPWTGSRRLEVEIVTDPYGEKLAPPTPACAPAGMMRFNPLTGYRFDCPVPEYRKRFPDTVWVYNPWTGSRRPEEEVEADPQGLKLEPPSHDPGTTSPPTPATTEAGTATQEPGARSHGDRDAPSPLSLVLSALGAAVTEVNALTRTATELAAKAEYRAEQDHARLREIFQQIAANADQSRFGRAVSLLAEEALNPKPGTGPHMRAAAGEGDEA